jgi:SAM-dependent methyltransferase
MPDDLPADLPAPLDAARSARSSDELRSLYAEWADRYDHDVYEVARVTGTDRIVELLTAYLPSPDVDVLDIGCGSGAAGVRLRQRGVTSVDGVDLSPEMLALAGATGAYRRCVEADLHERLAGPGPVGDRRYGACVSAGTFVAGHVGSDAVAHVLEVVEVGAVIAWVVHESLWPAVARELASCEELHRSIEATRRDGPVEAVMWVGRLVGRLRGR